MNRPINTLNADRRPRTPPVFQRFAQEIALMFGALLLLLVCFALASHSMNDSAWSTTGQAGDVANWLGTWGALFADAAYYVLGFSVWWLWLIGLRQWLATLARWLRGPEPAQVSAEREVPLKPWQRWRDAAVGFWLSLFVLLAASTTLEWTRLYTLAERLPADAGGVLGQILGPWFMGVLGFTGSALVCLILIVASTTVVLRFSWLSLAQHIGEQLDAWFDSRRERREAQEDQLIGERAAREREVVLAEERIEIEEQHQPPVVIEPVLVDVPRSERVAKERQKPLFQEMLDSKLPQVDLLDSAPAKASTVSPETLEMTSRLIEKKLKDFGVDVRVIAAAPGPVITRYEIEPATGVKGSQIVNLGRDLARSLSLVSIRVIETIPGKNLMALELPNAKRQTIKLSEILGSSIYNDARSLLTMGLGKDISGLPVVADLAKMPHCLVAGTTGSGKSVGINAMILSLLYKADAKDVRLLLIDPKMLEMSVYEGIPHLLAPVVTDMKQAAHGLNWCVGEMERRYKLMSKMGVRNLAGYNSKIEEAGERGELIGNPFSLNPDQPEPLETLPYIVVVIDELADLMMVVGKKIEELIARLAQKARAAGIHLILATQRPSVDVITGLIKANIPTRISFQVSSKIDSRTILDQMGAESLLGMGDMLYMPSGTGFPIRVHGAFVSDDEVHRVVAYLKEQGGEPNYVEGLLEGGTVDGGGETGDMFGGGDSEKDELYDQAVAIVLKDRKASISYVQRRLKIGYNRAARLLEEMENAGLVSALTSSGQRDILVPSRGE
ncbi:FtsK DNA segregation ATPase FtsK/SpoIIIE and related proteins [Burkholderiaceae bacterium]